jgi:DNA-directed RNA polymerase sigma subunit (sigma70/sigma32)
MSKTTVNADQSETSVEALKLAHILVERYGLDGKPPRSIAEVAERHGLSRLEVRFLEIKALLAIRPAFERKETS